MRFSELFREFEKKKIIIFSSRDVEMLFPSETKSVINISLSRWMKSGKVERLKKGLYELTYPVKRIIPDMYVANRLYNPSYISMETALSGYGLIPEVAMACISITTKPTREFRNSYGLFRYRTVRPSAFTGYRIEKNDQHDILIAEPEKAVADYFYFKKRSGSTGSITHERFDVKKLKKLSRQKLSRYFSLLNMSTQELDHAFK